MPRNKKKHVQKQVDIEEKKEVFEEPRNPQSVSPQRQLPDDQIQDFNGSRKVKTSRANAQHPHLKDLEWIVGQTEQSSNIEILVSKFKQFRDRLNSDCEVLLEDIQKYIT